MSLQLAFYVLFTAVNVPRKRNLGRAISKSIHEHSMNISYFIVRLVHLERTRTRTLRRKKAEEKGRTRDDRLMLYDDETAGEIKNPNPGASYGKLDSY